MTLRPAAAVLLWRSLPARVGAPSKDGVAQFQVYLVQRAERVLFMPGYWALPGGKVDAADVLAGEAGPDALAAKARCARRELFEECGVWSWAATSEDAAQRRARRQALLRGLGPKLPGAKGAQSLPVLAHFVTPPFSNVRFDTHYFALEAPPGAACDILPGELQAGRWLTPEEALSLHAAATLLLAPPVLSVLSALAETRGAAHARLAETAALLAQQNTAAGTSSYLLPGVVAAPLKSPTLPPSTHTNCYLLGEDAQVVVDPGTPEPEEQARLLAMLQARARRFGGHAPARAIWLTHHHADHVGAAMLLKRTFGGQICAHAETARRLPHVSVDRLLQDGECLPVAGRSWRVLHTPGHAAGHLCFYDADGGHLVSGDHVLGMGTPLVPPRPEGDMAAYMRELDRLLTLRLRLLLPGHGPPAALGRQRLVDTLRQRQARERLLLALLQGEAAPIAVPALVRKLYRGIAPGASSLATQSCLAHLEKLALEGRVQMLGTPAANARVSLSA